MTKELIDNLAQDPDPHSAYIEDFELREMAIAWAVEIRNAFELANSKEERHALNEHYLSLLENMDPALAKRFNGYLSKSMLNGTHKEWREPSERIRKTLQPKE